MNAMPPEHFERSIASARAAEFYHYASTLLTLYTRSFPREAAAFAATLPAAPDDRPLFSAVTGREFGRAIAWAKRTPNPVSAQIREHSQRVQANSPCCPLPATRSTR